MYLGGGTPIQTACGFEDSLDDMYRYMMAACGPDPDEAKIARYCAESLGHFDWLVARGVPFDPTFCADTSMAPTGTEGLVYSGGEDAYPFNEIARPAPRGAPGQDEALDRLAAHAAPGRGGHGGGRRGLDRHPGGPARGRRDGRVVGVQAQRFGETVSLRARRGVVLTAGGFIFNDDMLRQHCPPLAARHLQGGDRGRRRARHPHGPGHRGLGPQHVRGGGLAADHAAAHPDPRHPRQRPGPALHQRGHLHGTCRPVGPLRAGRRGLPAGRRGVVRGELDGPGRHLGLRDGRAARGGDGPAGRVASLDARPLQRARGAGRGPAVPQGSRAWVRPLVPPIGAFDLRIGPAPYAPFTLGGLETTVDGAVLDVSGQRHPGLVRGGPHDGGGLLLRLRQRAVDRRQHDVRALRRGQRGGAGVGDLRVLSRPRASIARAVTSATRRTR